MFIAPLCKNFANVYTVIEKLMRADLKLSSFYLELFSFYKCKLKLFTFSFSVLVLFAFEF